MMNFGVFRKLLCNGLSVYLVQSEHFYRYNFRTGSRNVNKDSISSPTYKAMRTPKPMHICQLNENNRTGNQVSIIYRNKIH